MMEQMENIVTSKGEGLILRKPGSRYLIADSFFKTAAREAKEMMVTSVNPLQMIEYVMMKVYLSSADGHSYHALVSLQCPVIPYRTIVTVEPTGPKLRESVVVVKKVCDDVTWEMLLRERYPYYVGRGKSSMATCRTCGFKFTKDELRVRFEVNRRLGHSPLPACEVNVCMKLSCIRSAYRNVSLKPLFTPFRGEVFVPRETRSQMQSIVIPGIRWIYDKKPEETTVLAK